MAHRTWRGAWGVGRGARMVRIGGGAEFRHGWPAVVATFVATTLGIGSIFFYSLGVFMKPLQAEFGWGRSALSVVSLCAIICAACMAPVFGAWADRVGARMVGCLSLAGLAAGFALVSLSGRSLGLFVLANSVLAIAGAGTSAAVFGRLIILWFAQARGMALGIAAAGNGLAGILVPRLLPGFVVAHGWRAGYLLLAVLPLLAIPVVFLCADDRGSGRTQSADAPEQGLTMAQARRERRFWQLAAAFGLASVAISGFVVHIIPLLSDTGLSLPQAGRIAGLFGVTVVAGRLLTGALIDRLFAPGVAATLFVAAACGCVLLAAGGAARAPAAALLMGVSFGAEVDIVAFLTARYFGLRAFGAIYGTLYGCMIGGAAFGPLLTGLLHGWAGGYGPALMADAVALIGAAALLLGLGRYPGTAAEG